MHWVTATDENGNDFCALTAHPEPEAEKHVPVWVFFDGPSGFGNDVGSVALHQLKKLDNGKFGA